MARSVFKRDWAGPWKLVEVSYSKFNSDFDKVESCLGKRWVRNYWERPTEWDKYQYEPYTRTETGPFVEKYIEIPKKTVTRVEI